MTVRGQYRAGAIDGGAVPGYARGDRRRATSDTETFVALKAEIDNWRWAGVPFYLRTGKRLPRARLRDRRSRSAASRIRSSTPRPAPSQPNQLVMRLQPDEGVKLWLMIKDPGPGRHAAAARAAQHELRRGLRRALSRTPMSAC